MSTLWVSYPSADDTNRDGEADAIARQLGGKWSGSGHGFGSRDIEFIFDPAVVRKAAVEFIRAGFDANVEGERQSAN